MQFNYNITKQGGLIDKMSNKLNLKQTKTKLKYKI